MVRLYYVLCDGCGEPCGGRPDLRKSGVDARSTAKQRGWTRLPRRTGFQGGSPGADYCPNCATNPAVAE